MYHVRLLSCLDINWKDRLARALRRLFGMSHGARDITITSVGHIVKYASFQRQRPFQLDRKWNRSMHFKVKLNSYSNLSKVRVMCAEHTFEALEIVELTSGLMQYQKCQISNATKGAYQYSTLIKQQPSSTYVVISTSVRCLPQIIEAWPTKDLVYQSQEALAHTTRWQQRAMQPPHTRRVHVIILRACGFRARSLYIL